MSSDNPFLQDAPRVARCKVCNVSLYEGRCLDNHPQPGEQHDAQVKRDRTSKVQRDLHGNPMYKMIDAGRGIHDCIATTLAEFVLSDDVAVLDYAGRVRTSRQLKDAVESQNRVLRFWYCANGRTMPSAEQISTAMSWEGFRTFVYTNVSGAWNPAWKICSFEEIPCFNNLLPQFENVPPQHMKDIWQFIMPKYVGGWTVDWDVRLLVADRLPTNCPVIGTEPVKTKGRAPRPSTGVDEGERLHLAISRFDVDDPWCEEITALLVRNLPKLKGIDKKHAHWMLNTYTVQEYLVSKDCPLAPSIIFNPLPLFLKSAEKLGQTMWGSCIPSLEQIAKMSATVNTWAGYDGFPQSVISDIVAKVFKVQSYMLHLQGILGTQGM